LIDLSAAPDHTTEPATARPSTRFSCASKRSSNAPVAPSHAQMQRSYDADHTTSADTDTMLVTILVCARSTSTGRYVFGSQRMIALSVPIHTRPP
jgi:hypothetical protein